MRPCRNNVDIGVDFSRHNDNAEYRQRDDYTDRYDTNDAIGNYADDSIGNRAMFTDRGHEHEIDHDCW